MKRFWQKVKKTNTCWNWNTSLDKNGYGKFYYQGKTYRAHRFVWFLTYNFFPKQFLLHICDNTSCVNPKHLFEGTQANNMQDMSSKKRSLSGKKNPNHKLTEDQVVEIRKKYQPFIYTQKQLAKEYHINRRTVQQVVYNQTWKQL